MFLLFFIRWIMENFEQSIVCYFLVPSNLDGLSIIYKYKSRNVAGWFQWKKVNNAKTFRQLKTMERRWLTEYFMLLYFYQLFFTSRNKLLNITNDSSNDRSMCDGKNWIVSFVFELRPTIYIYTFINRWLVGIGEIEKFELKIGVFDRNESERNLPREKVEI